MAWNALGNSPMSFQDCAEGKDALFESDALPRPLQLSRCALGKLIRVWALPLDCGFHVLVAGGDMSHVGAISGAGYSERRARDAGKAVMGGQDTPMLPTQTLAFGTHQEGVITEKWASELARFCGVPCTVACGIHYEGLSQEGISQVIAVCAELLEDLKARIK